MQSCLNRDAPRFRLPVAEQKAIRSSGQCGKGRHRETCSASSSANLRQALSRCRWRARPDPTSAQPCIRADYRTIPWLQTADPKTPSTIESAFSRKARTSSDPQWTISRRHARNSRKGKALSDSPKRVLLMVPPAPFRTLFHLR
jgi:hypothetical protein